MFYKWPFGVRLIYLLCPLFCLAQTDSKSGQGLDDLSLADLLNLNISLASRTEEPISEAPSIAAVITAQDIQNMGARSFEDILRQIPGFDLVLNPSTSNLGIAVRGVLSTNATNNQVKFLINGHHVHSIVGGGPHHYLDYLPVHNILKIEIIRGPGSALYGANAFSAVINIITKGTESQSEASIEAGSYDTLRPSLFWANEYREWQMAFSASMIDTDGYRGKIKSDAATNLFGPSFSGAPGYTTQAADNLTLQADVAYKNFKLTGLYNRLDKQYAVGIANALTDESQLEVEAGFTELSYTHELGSGKGSFNFRTYYDFFNFSPRFEVFSEETSQFFNNIVYPNSPGFPEGESVMGQPGVDFYLIGSEITAKYDPMPGIQLLGGVLYDYSKIFNPTHMVNANITGAPLQIGDRIFGPFQYIGPLTDIAELPGGSWIQRGDRTNFATYAQTRIDFGTLLDWTNQIESFALTLGLRHDDYDDIGSSTNPRVGLVFSPSPKIFFKGLYGEAFRAPTFDELYQINNPSFIGNPNLRPQKLVTKEFQVGTNYTEHWVATLSFFDTRIEDIINLVPISEPGQTGNQFRNEGQIHAEGIEIDTKYAFSKTRNVYFNFTYQKAQNTTNEMIAIPSQPGQEIVCTQPDYNVGNIPKAIYNAGFNVDLWERLNWNAYVNYTTDRERSGQLTFLPEESVIIHNGSSCVIDRLVRVDQRSDTPSRLLFNTSIQMEFGRGLHLKLSGFNLLDEDHRDPDSSGAILEDIPRPGANFTFTASYKF